ncbi:MAG TPA: hypothetical protein VIR78_03895 [Malonomonas sp.]
MRRFRVTLLVVCLLLGWLGYTDLSLLLRNRAPQQLSISELEAQGPAQEWLNITGGYQDLLQAINMSGTVEIDSFLIPLKRSVSSPDNNVWFETRDPQIVAILKTYYFNLETDAQRQQFREDNRKIFNAQRDISGMTVDSLIADSNSSKLKDLLQEMQLPVADNVIFISEGKQPVALRGFFFAAMSLIGLLKLLFDLLNRGKKPLSAPAETA